MANGLYPVAGKAFMDAGIDLLDDDIRVLLVDLADYSYSDSHDFLDDVAGGAIVSTSAALSNKSTTAGVFDADDETLSSVSGDQSEALIIYKHTGTAGTSNLILFIDTGVTGFPVTPNGGNITLQWNGSGIFEIAL